MVLNEYPHAIFKGQDDKAVRIQLCFRGDVDHNFYCVNLRVPKDKLVQMHGEHTAAGEPDIDT